MSARVFSTRRWLRKREILVMCETFRPNYFADFSLSLSLSLYLSICLYLYFSFEFYFSTLPRTRLGTTCLAGDQGAAARLFFGRLEEKKSTGILSRSYIFIIVQSDTFKKRTVRMNALIRDDLSIFVARHKIKKYRYNTKCQRYTARLIAKLSKNCREWSVRN